MGFLSLVIISMGLAMDATAVSLSAGAAGRSQGGRAAFRLAFHFGLFQALMPLIGWLIGHGVMGLFQTVDHWLAFGLLVIVGARMIRSGSRPEAGPQTGDPSRGWSLVALSVATSIDALAVGLGLAVLDVDIWLPCLMIGLITAAMSLAGLSLGRALHGRWGGRMEIMGGLLLMGIGLQILINHLRA